MKFGEDAKSSETTTRDYEEATRARAVKSPVSLRSTCSSLAAPPTPKLVSKSPSSSSRPTKSSPRPSRVPILKVACEKFNITYSNADQAKIDIIRALEVQYEKKVPLSWVLSKLKSKLIGNDDAAATENTVKKRKSDNITIGDAFQTTLNLSAKYHSAPRVALAQIDPNSASRP